MVVFDNFNQQLVIFYAQHWLSINACTKKLFYMLATKMSKKF